MAAGIEGLRPVGGGARDRHRGLPHIQIADAVQDRDPTQRPPLEELGGEVREPPLREIHPRLVAEPRDGPRVGVIADRPQEHRAAAGRRIGDEIDCLLRDDGAVDDAERDAIVHVVIIRTA